MGDNEVDWLTGSKQVEINDDFEDVRVDVRYFEARHDAAAGEIRIDPAQETYRTVTARAEDRAACHDDDAHH